VHTVDSLGEVRAQCCIAKPQLEEARDAMVSRTAILRFLMEGRLVLKNCTLFRLDGRIQRGMAAVIENGKIAKIADDGDVPILPGDWEVACRERLVAPGAVDSHAHLVGAQLAPFGGGQQLDSQAARSAAREEVEAQLTPTEVEALSAFAIARALREGVTTVIEHLHCPRTVAGGLQAQAGAAERLGMRLVNSHASHSKLGAGSAAEQLEANAAHVEARSQHPLVRGALGFDASSTCDDDLLLRLGRLREELKAAVQGHVGESQSDVAVTEAKYGEPIVARLARHGLLGRGFIAAHTSALSRSDVEKLAASGTALALSPARELIDEAAGGSWEALAAQHSLAALGSADSMSIWDEVIPAFAASVRCARLGGIANPEALMRRLLFAAPAELCSFIFGAPSVPVEPGSQADLVVYDLLPSTDAWGRSPSLSPQLARSRAAWTIVAGQVVVREGQLLAHDYLELAADAGRALRSLQRRTGAQLSSDVACP
jgi:cytosine/adenosine deaminase-related metal-dependent hydrolase